MANGKDEIEVEDLPNELLNAEDYVKLPRQIQSLVQKMQAALEKYNHNLNMVANIFGISRTTLWRYRQKHKL
jgi:transcriptional regulator of acetoin/glycerol metabolism